MAEMLIILTMTVYLFVHFCQRGKHKGTPLSSQWKLSQASKGHLRLLQPPSPQFAALCQILHWWKISRRFSTLSSTKIQAFFGNLLLLISRGLLRRHWSWIWMLDVTAPLKAELSSDEEHFNGSILEHFDWSIKWHFNWGLGSPPSG